MISIDRRLFSYVAMYYDFNFDYKIPENITICIPEDYKGVISQCATDYFGNDSEVPDMDTDGMMMVSNKGEYFVAVDIQEESLPEGVELLPEHVNTLFHELSHIHTLPETDLFELKEYDNRIPGARGMDGYMFWREFTATYMGMHTFFNTCGEIKELESEEDLFQTCMKKLKRKTPENLDVLISLLLMSEANIFPRLKRNLTEYSYNALKDLVDETCRYRKHSTLNCKTYDQIGRILAKLEITCSH